MKNLNTKRCKNCKADPAKWYAHPVGIDGKCTRCDKNAAAYNIAQRKRVRSAWGSNSSEMMATYK